MAIEWTLIYQLGLKILTNNTNMVSKANELFEAGKERRARNT